MRNWTGARTNSPTICVALGVTPDSLVAVCLDRSLELFVALLGILKAGAAYLPLDPSYPLARLSFMLADAGSPLLLTTEALADELPTQWTHACCCSTLTGI